MALQATVLNQAKHWCYPPRHPEMQNPAPDRTIEEIENKKILKSKKKDKVFIRKAVIQGDGFFIQTC